MKSSLLSEATLDSKQVSATSGDRDQYKSDWGTSDDAGHAPDLVVWPESTDDVASVLRFAHERGVPVTPYAAGTSLEGNPIPVSGGITLDVTRMDRILDVRPEDFQIDVQAGVYGSAINEAIEKHGLYFPPLPSSGKISTIGGMIANDASGMQTVKYGKIHDWVLRMEAVLADGTVIETGSRAAKTSSGYNLDDLLVGSEGTLGIITDVTLELAGIPEQIHGGRAIFDTRRDASIAISDAIQSGVDVAKIELVDALSAEITNEYLGADFSDSPMVFLEFHANHGIEEEIDFCRSIFESHDVVSFEIASQDAEMEQLWEIRREMAEALAPYRKDLEPLTPGDVTVPISSFPDLLDYIQELEEEHELLIPCFGHAGDGNIHPTILYEADDPEREAIARQVNEKIVSRAIEMRGTSTGEHGIGLGKQEYLEKEYGKGTVDAMRAVKRALDPKGILNPGKVLPPE